MAIKWHSGTKTVRIESLKLSGKFKARLAAPHVLGLAKSIVDVGPINPPAVCWKLDGVIRREVAAGEDRVAAHVLAACHRVEIKSGGTGGWSSAVTMAMAGQGTKGTIEVRAFDGDEQGLREVRAHENAHRRHDDRDAWLAGLAARPGDEEIPTTERGADGGDAHQSGEDPCKGKASDGPTGDAPAPGDASAVAGGSASPGSVALDPSDNIAQGFFAVPVASMSDEEVAGMFVNPPALSCICGHTFEQHGDFGSPNCTECVCEMYETPGEDAAPLPDGTPCAGCAHAVIDHQGADGGCEAKKCKCREFVRGYLHRSWNHENERPWTPENARPACGAEASRKLLRGSWDDVDCPACLKVGEDGGHYSRNKLLRSEPTKESPREKGARRKKAAELATTVTGKPVTSAAVKQAEYRERKRKGEVATREKHDDGGPALPESAMPVLRALIDCDANLQALITRLGNALREHPELSERLPPEGGQGLDACLQAAKDLRKQLRAHQPHSPCPFCFVAVKKDPKAACNSCHGVRWSTKTELEAAPAELRAQAGL